MQKQLYKCEVGVLLTEKDKEFESYRHVYTKNFGFYDEDNSYFKHLAEAVRYGTKYIQEGVKMTYAVITSDSYDGDDEALVSLVDAIVQGEEEVDSSWDFRCDESEILYFSYKSDSGIVISINKLPQAA